MTFEENGLLVDDAHMESFGENCARSLHPAARIPARRIIAALRRDLRRIEGFYNSLAQRQTAAVSGAERWLLDNHWLIRREGGAAAAGLRQGGRFRGAGEASLLSVLCRGLLRSGPGALNEARTGAFLRGFQRQHILESAELSLIPAEMKAEIIASLAELYGETENRSPAGRSADERSGEASGRVKRAEALFTALRPPWRR